jgi:HK97 family phage major capsid protein
MGPNSVGELLAERHDLFVKADAVLQKAKQTGVDLRGDDSITFEGCIASMRAIDAKLDRIEKVGAPFERERGFPAYTQPSHSAPPVGMDNGPKENRLTSFPDSGRFVMTGRVGGGISASLQEGSDLSVAVPPYELESFRVIAPQLMPFELAGATVFTSDSFGVRQEKVPFILPNAAAPAVFAEGAGPSTVQDCVVKGITLTPAKYAPLTKISEESDADIIGVGAAIVQEGISRVYTATEAAATAALKTSLTAASATVALGTDNLKSLLNLEAAIPQAFANPSNALMLSRASLSRLRNTRDGQSRPIFDPINKTMLGYRCVLNDALDVTGHHYIVFGNWGAGAFVSYSQFLILRLMEAYRESGQIGIRFARRMASAFFSDASTGATQPLYMQDLGA